MYFVPTRNKKEHVKNALPEHCLDVAKYGAICFAIFILESNFNISLYG